MVSGFIRGDVIVNTHSLPQKHKDQYTAKVEELIGEFGKLRLPSVPSKYLPSHTQDS